MNNKTNCPNCGAAIDTNVCKCPYCGTSYFDLSSIDLINHEPIYLKIRTDQGTITQMCIPELGSIEITTDTQDIIDGMGNRIMTCITNRNMMTNVTFKAISNPESNVLYTMEVGDDL